MKGWQVVLLVGGLAAVGGGVYLVMRPSAPSMVGRPPLVTKPSQSVAGSLISQVGGRALSLGIDKLGSVLENQMGSWFA